MLWTLLCGGRILKIGVLAFAGPQISPEHSLARAQVLLILRCQLLRRQVAGRLRKGCRHPSATAMPPPSCQVGNLATWRLVSQRYPQLQSSGSY